MYNYKVGFVIRLMRLALGVFFVTLGICGIFRELNASVFSLQYYYTVLEVVFGIVEVICGLLLAAGFFIFKDSQPVFWGGFIAFILWCIRIIFSKFIWGMNFFIGNGNISIPIFIQWLLILVVEIIIALSLLVVIKRYE
jgi:hypothetical protein